MMLLSARETRARLSPISPVISAAWRFSASRRDLLATPFSSMVSTVAISSSSNRRCSFPATTWALRPVISRRCFSIRSLRMDSSLAILIRRAWKRSFWPAIISPIVVSSARPSSSSGKAMSSRPSRSASSRACCARAAAYRPFNRSNRARA